MQGFCHGEDDFISYLMSVSIIDGFEIVDIQLQEYTFHIISQKFIYLAFTVDSIVESGLRSVSESACSSLRPLQIMTTHSYHSITIIPRFLICKTFHIGIIRGFFRFMEYLIDSAGTQEYKGFSD